MKVLLFIVFLCLFIQCTRRQRIPDDVLPPEKMEKVLWDMVRADQFASDYLLPSDTSLNRKTESMRLYQQVFQINGISYDQFARSFKFYRSNPRHLKTVIDSIVTNQTITYPQAVP